MKKKRITLTSISKSVDDLIGIVKEGFGKVYAEMVTKKEFNERFDDLEAEVSPHGRRLDRLEDKVRQISTKIGLK